MNPREIHPLALWDAPFLPGTVGERGWALREGAKLALSARRQLAAQLAAAVAFCLDQGFYPERRVLRGARFDRSEQGVWLRFHDFPRWTLDHPRLGRALAPGRRGERLPWLVLRSFLEELLPEDRCVWEELDPEADPWVFPKILVKKLLGRDRGGRTLDHPLGWGRFLWARRFRLPEEGGVFYLDDPSTAGRLAELGVVVAGEFTREELARQQAQALATSGPLVLVTTAPLPDLPSLPLDEPAPLWCLLPPGDEARAAESLAGLGAPDSGVAGLALRRAVMRSWGVGRRSEPSLAGLLSYPARRLASLLERAGVGLTAEEAAAVAGGEALPELRRFGLVVQRFGRWFWFRAAAPAPEAWQPLLEHLPAGPLRWVLEAAAGGSASPLEAWCERCLEEGHAEALLGLAPLAGAVPALRVAVTEAALTLGWLSFAEPWLDHCPPPFGPLFRLWWGVSAGDEGRVGQALPALGALPVGELPPRLTGRCLLLEATVAERRGEGEEARRLGRQVLALPDLDHELLAEAAYLAGDDHLQRLSHEPQLSPAGRQRVQHLLGVRAMHRGDPEGAAAHLRQALNAASGRNPLRFGELLADAGAVAMLLDRPLEAERLYSAAEFWLALAGSRRAVRLVSFNRAVLANDRLQWRQARELLARLASADEEENPRDRAFRLVEWGRSLLSEGEVEKAAATVNELDNLLRTLPENENLRQGLSVLRAHLALLRGRLGEAEAWGERAEPSERALFSALFASREGTMPDPKLPDRWGLVATARVLASAKASGSQLAALAENALTSANLEPAVGLARALLLAPAWGVDLAPWVRGWLPRLEARLREAGLAGWVRLLEERWGRDWVGLLGIVASLHGRGTDFWRAAEWRQLLDSLHLSGLSVTLQGRELLRLGSVDGDGEQVIGPFRVRWAGPGDAEVGAVLRLVLQKAPVPLLAAPADHLGLTGASPSIVSLREEIARYAPLSVTVLILGEPGTGKERVARALHNLSGRRGEFVAVNCAGIPENLLEVELFGVVRGAFTGADRDRPGLVEQAEGGTLFLDEIGELPLSMQAKLLRLLQEREVRRVGGVRSRKVDVRFVAATNRDLRHAVAEGRFRQDLFDRVATVVLRVPPLRERVEDIPLLVGELVNHFAAQFGLDPVAVEPEFLARLARHTWPGNVRELESVLVQALVRCPRGQALSSRDLPTELGAESIPPAEPPIVPLEVAEKAFLREYFRRLLERTGGNRTRAAKLAGLSRQALSYRLRQLGLAGHEDGD